MQPPKVLIVAEHASYRYGGEASLPLHYFLGLRRKGLEVWLIAHARTRVELMELLGPDIDRVTFIEDDNVHLSMWKLGQYLPDKLSYLTTGYISRMHTQRRACQIARRIIALHGIDILHQPIPVSPREPSLIHGLGVPVVMGPMNGNMTYPPAFVRGNRQVVGGIALKLARFASELMHHVMPGKKKAALLLAANRRTLEALPKAAVGRTALLHENAVDPLVWQASQTASAPPRDGFQVVFMGRLVDWKRLDIVIKALAAMSTDTTTRLLVIGDGQERRNAEALSRELGLQERIEFTGWLSQPEAARRLSESDCLVLPSINECGGAVVLEAMALGKPVVATGWGGPLDYVTPETGFLIPPDSETALIEGFAHSLSLLASDESRRQGMGAAAKQRIRESFLWDDKIDAMLQHFLDLRSSRNVG